MNTALHFSSVDRNLETPPEVFNPLHAEFQFGLDACATDDSARLPVYITPEIDTLTQDWGMWCGGRPVFFNPPYGDPEQPCKGAVQIAYEADRDNEAETRIEAPRCKKIRCEKRGYHINQYVPGIMDFVAKAYLEMTLGVTSVGLLPARTDTDWWHTYIWDETQHQPRPGIWHPRFVKGRIRFRRGTQVLDGAPFPSVIVIFSQVEEATANFRQGT